MTTCIKGVWQDGFAVSYAAEEAYGLGIVALGTHVGNHPHLEIAVMVGGVFEFYDVTYDMNYCLSYTETYMSLYGASYAAYYYRSTACNVRSLAWV